MKIWKQAILWSVLWLALMLGIAILHTNVIRAGVLTPEQDKSISENYGRICGLGLPAIWLFLYFSHRRSLRRSP